MSNFEGVNPESKDSIEKPKYLNFKGIEGDFAHGQSVVLEETSRFGEYILEGDKLRINPDANYAASMGFTFPVDRESFIEHESLEPVTVTKRTDGTYTVPKYRAKPL